VGGGIRVCILSALEWPWTKYPHTSLTSICVQAVNVQNDISQMVFVVADSPRAVEATVAKPGQIPFSSPRSALPDRGFICWACRVC
jgi:hypothetical protein